MKSLLLSSHEVLYYKSLNERQRRLYVALKAIELGWNGVAMVCKAYQINRKTIYKGKKELLMSENEVTSYICRQKKKGQLVFTPWLPTFDSVLSMSTAGLPQDKSIKWTYLTQEKIQSALLAKNIVASRYYVKLMLTAQGYSKRKMLKMDTTKAVANRNEQFLKIATYRAEFAAQGYPILSIDTKNKELLGNFARSGRAYAQDMRTRRDHDFKSDGDIKMVPHGIYDTLDNTGYVTLGTSYDTSAFVCDNIATCWTQHLQYKYADAHTILLLCDGGGSNASAHYIVKKDLIELSNKLNINILVAHYPPYCSKWNPIEHRLFSQISHTWDGVSLTDLDFVKDITNTTTTKTGLKVVTAINEKIYTIKRPVEQEFKDNIKSYVQFDEQLPKWNYLIKPQICPT